MYMCFLSFAFPGFSFVAFSFSTLILLVGSFWPVKTISYITYTVLVGTYNTTQSNPIVLSWGLMKRRSVQLYGPIRLYKDFTLLSVILRWMTLGFTLHHLSAFVKKPKDYGVGGGFVGRRWCTHDASNSRYTLLSFINWFYYVRTAVVVFSLHCTSIANTVVKSIHWYAVYLGSFCLVSQIAFIIGRHLFCTVVPYKSQRGLLRYDTKEEFNMDWKAECGQLNLSSTHSQKQKSIKKKLKPTNASAHLVWYMLTLWRPLLPYEYSTAIKHPAPHRVKSSFVIFDTLSIRVPRCQKKITNDGLTLCGAGCFLAVPIWQHCALKGVMCCVLCDKL